MKKHELLEYVQKEHERALESIKALPETKNAECFHTRISGSYLTTNVGSIEELRQKLRSLSAELGKYQLKSYWITYGESVSAEYYFGDLRCIISINTEDASKVITILSDGKCSVVEKTSREVVCDL